MQNKLIKGLLRLLHIHRTVLLNLSQSPGSPWVSVKYLTLCYQLALFRVLRPFPFGEEGRPGGGAQRRGARPAP